MSIFGAIMAFIFMGWTLVTVLLVGIAGGPIEFLRSSALMLVLVVYVVLLVIYLVAKKIADAM